MAVSHVKSNAVGNWTGTVTVFNSQGLTTARSATDFVRATDWNSAHNRFYTLSGNTNNASTLSGTNILFEGLGSMTLRGSNSSLGFSATGLRYTINWPVNHNQIALDTLALNNRPVFYLVPMSNINFSSAVIGFLFSNATNSTGSVTLSATLAYFTRNGSSLSMFESTSTSLAMTFSGTVNNSTQVGTRLLPIPWTKTITEGDYWFGLLYRTTSGGANATLPVVVASQAIPSWAGQMGLSTHGSRNVVIGVGGYTSTTVSMPNPVPLASIIGSNWSSHRAFCFGFIVQSA